MTLTTNNMGEMGSIKSLTLSMPSFGTLLMTLLATFRGGVGYSISKII